MARRKRIKVVFGEKINTADDRYFSIEAPRNNEMYNIVIYKLVDGNDMVIDILQRTEKQVCADVDFYLGVLISI